MDDSEQGLNSSAQGSGLRGGSKPAPGLYLVATPIGNLRDITLRGLDLLQQADVIACEDTRMTGKLLTLLGVGHRPLSPYHEHNETKATPALLDRIAAGQSVVLVSDAGMPLISDPGYRLVRACAEAGLPVTAAPGASAPLTALALSGLPSDRFLFAGFTPHKSAGRRDMFANLAAIPATLIFFESPNRLPASLQDMADIFGEREAAVARELTKMHEQVMRGTLPDLALSYARSGPPKGEVVVVIGPPLAAKPAEDSDIDSRLEAEMKRLSPRDAATLVAAELNLPRRAVYQRAIALAKRDDDGT